MDRLVVRDALRAHEAAGTSDVTAQATGNKRNGDRKHNLKCWRNSRTADAFSAIEARLDMAKALTLTHVDTDVTFYHQNDERAFFEWLARISCIESYGGEGKLGLVVHLKRKPGNDDLRQLLALCYRYGVGMRQLANFETAKNRSWFRDPGKYWHHSVFGPASDQG